MSTTNMDVQEELLEYKPTNNYINKIEITKVRHLKDITIDVTEGELKHLILTGKNGSGKTTVLEKIRDYLSSIIDENYYNIMFHWQEELVCCNHYIEELNKIKLDKGVLLGEQVE